MSGDHHRDYYFTLTVNNLASLSTTVTFDLLLDESPPSRGVVWEGLSVDGQAEMDFTSSNTVHVQWHGYEDHESGVRLYRVVIANRCVCNWGKKLKLHYATLMDITQAIFQHKSD